jgi:Na+/H+-dicarboxylate symporter
MADGRMLQIIFFALLLGISLTMLPDEKSQPVLGFFDGLNEAMIRIVDMVMLLAPYGVFALMAHIISVFGPDILEALAWYSGVVVLGLAIHACVIYPAAVKTFTRLSLGKFFKGIRKAQLIAFSSSSSSATLPVTMECVEHNMGVSPKVCSFVLPLGATINMDGTALYQGVAAVFIAQVYGLQLGPIDQLTIILTATLASVGAAGVPGVGMITLALVLQSIHIPLEGIALILGVDRILDMCRTAVNVTGDASAAAVIAATEEE